VNGVEGVAGVGISGVLCTVGVVAYQAVLDELGETALHLEQRDVAEGISNASEGSPAILG